MNCLEGKERYRIIAIGLGKSEDLERVLDGFEYTVWKYFTTQRHARVPHYEAWLTKEEITILKLSIQVDMIVPVGV